MHKSGKLMCSFTRLKVLSLINYGIVGCVLFEIMEIYFVANF